ncbi:Microcystin LR degradation protein MlrC [Thozetella sp. PMI_491]|nr:Microcystin LR degradation protein MlrC [Thozetella sp. PMI_491]
MASRQRPVIAIAGMASENSAFSPSTTDYEAFKKFRGEEISQHYPWLRQGEPLCEAADWRKVFVARALPGGSVMREAFETIAEEIVAGLQSVVSSLPDGKSLDGLWYDIHGAMVVQGYDDIEVELLQRIRAVVGPKTIISASMDLHGNVSRELAHQLDLVTCYRLAPHEDAAETHERACRNLVDVLTNRTQNLRPYKAWIPIPVLLPGEQTSTRLEPAKHIYQAVPEVEAMDGILDAAIWVGYAWADAPRNRAAVVVTGWREDAVAAGAEKLAQLFWAAHKDFKFVAPTGSFSECLDTALASPKKPYFISDSGDNPTAGGSGDMSWGLTQLLARPEFKDESGATAIYASVPGREAVKACVEAGIGATVTVTVGAEFDSVHAGPLTVTGRVHAIKHGDMWAGTEVVLQVGSVFAIITKLRKPYHKEHDFTELNLVPRKADIVIVKIGYLEPELYNMASDWMLALTPGGVDQDLRRLGHKRIRRPMWPFDTEFKEEPNLRARFVPMSNEPLDGRDE